MKLLQKLLPLFLLVAGAYFFQSCKKEKTEKPSSTYGLVGKWESTKGKVIVYYEDEFEYEFEYDTQSEIWTFKDDGTGLFADNTGFKYEIVSENTLKLIDYLGNNQEEVYYFELSGTSLFLKSRKVKDIDEGKETENEFHIWFKKI